MIPKRNDAMSASSFPGFGIGSKRNGDQRQRPDA
jgi:hypothetical protein